MSRCAQFLTGIVWPPHFEFVLLIIDLAYKGWVECDSQATINYTNDTEVEPELHVSSLVR
jgi:hypothetical protein